MKRFTLAAVLVVLAVLVVSGIGVILLNLGQTPANPGFPTLYTYHVVKSYPHDTSAFTEGLVFDNGALYESTGGYGSSSLRQVNLEDGSVRQELLLPSQYFGEGLTVVNGSLIQLTWQENISFIYSKETFGLLGNFSYPTQGWGLAYNGSDLIMSDGTSNLYFLNAVTYQKVEQVNVHDGNIPVTNINELEYIKGDVYANIWLTQKIAIINPKTGSVKGWIDMAGLYQSDDSSAVLNGIAYDQKTDRLFITGKDWPSLYQITIAPKIR